MAFIHCHECNWGQDDFWDKRYNPIRQFFGVNLPMTWKPVFVKFDEWALKEMGVKYQPVLVGGLRGQGEVHTWRLLWWHFARMLRKFRHQHWWTWGSYQRDKNKKCPKCGNRGLCID